MMRRPLYPYEAFAGESIEASELLAGEHVEMDVVDRLAGELADVRDHAVAVREAVTSAAEAKCCFGITRKCLGASGAMSRNARHLSSS
mgnify:CR=1 FL=1